MQNLPFILAALACPVSMGLMMFFMMRPGAKPTDQQPGADQQEIAELRTEVARLRIEQEQPSAKHMRQL